MTRWATLLLAITTSPLAAADRADILVADFEGETYGEAWKTTGTAFGAGPAKGTQPNQMPVSGYQGKGLVNSYKDGDGSTGTLTAPEFKIERRYINFLVGGGKHPGKTCVNLLIEGKVVHTATGPNDKPGGSERLDWHTWDVTKYEGKTATIQIVDDEKGGWGHVNVDHIVQSDTKKQAERVEREFTVDKRYLHLPVKNGAPKRRVTLAYGIQILREFDIELAEGDPDFWVFVDVSPFKGGLITVATTMPSGSKALDALKLAENVPDAEKLYKEKHRPLFHFTSRVGWLNDPNGLVYVPDKELAHLGKGEWHLFYQHNPYGREWGNMHWGHAVSPDLFRWKEQPIALYPKKYGDWAFSGSAVVDHSKSTKEKPFLTLAYTSTGRGECIAFSENNGRTWQEYTGNPVVKHAGRDPKLIWYEKGKHWVMAVYDEFEKKQWIAFYTSPDLKKWTFASRIEGFYECPDLFPLTPPNLDLMGGGPLESKWVLYAADGKYLIGDFDGKTFKPDFQEKKQLWYGNFYAAQTFDNAPNLFANVRPVPPLQTSPPRVQIGWARGVTFPGMPFNQQMTVPVGLQLLGWRNPGEKGPQLTAMPMDYITSLRDGKGTLVTQPVKETVTLAENLDAFDAELTIDVKVATKGFTLDLRGTKLVYDAAKETLTCKDVTAPLKGQTVPGGVEIRLRILVDRGSVEVFANHGVVAMSVAAIPDEKKQTLELTPNDGTLIVRGGVWRMKSAWEK